MRHADCSCKFPHATLDGCKRQRELARNIAHGLDERVHLRSQKELAFERSETPDESAADDELPNCRCAPEREWRTPAMEIDDIERTAAAQAEAQRQLEDEQREIIARAERVAERVAEYRQRRDAEHRRPAPARETPTSEIDPQLYAAAVRDAAQRLNDAIKATHAAGFVVDMRATYEGGGFFTVKDEDGMYMQLQPRVLRPL